MRESERTVHWLISVNDSPTGSGGQRGFTNVPFRAEDTRLLCDTKGEKKSKKGHDILSKAQASERQQKNRLAPSQRKMLVAASIVLVHFVLRGASK